MKCRPPQGRRPCRSFDCHLAPVVFLPTGAPAPRIRRPPPTADGIRCRHHVKSPRGWMTHAPNGAPAAEARMRARRSGEQAAASSAATRDRPHDERHPPASPDEPLARAYRAPRACGRSRYAAAACHRPPPRRMPSRPDLSRAPGDRRGGRIRHGLGSPPSPSPRSRYGPRRWNFVVSLCRGGAVVFLPPAQPPPHRTRRAALTTRASSCHHR